MPAVLVGGTTLFCASSAELPSPALLGPVFTPIELAIAVVEMLAIAVARARILEILARRIIDFFWLDFDVEEENA